MLRTVRTLWQNTEGAVAPTVALSMIGLIVAGGIAFDYAQVASLDTELQNAADQAALAAASQLDGQAGACERAVAAARELISNSTLISNDGNVAGAKILIAPTTVCGSDTSITFDAAASIRFYKDEAKATPSDDDSNAKFVEVTVDPRKVNYALTPIVGAISSPNLKATAFAGLREAICRVPPLMLCNPAEDDNAATDDVFDIGNLAGRGLRLVANDGGGMSPGNFGYLDNGADDQQKLKMWLGHASPPGDCTPVNDVETIPGAREAVISAFNTRFDMYASGQLNVIGCDPPSGKCPPSFNSVKDLVMQRNGPNLACSPTTGNGTGWQEAANNYYSLVTSATTLSSTVTPGAMGHPRDLCHAHSNEGSCSYPGDPNNPASRIGSGEWDINAYWRVNHGGANYPPSMNAVIEAATGTAIPAGRTYPTRYQIYLWEMGNAAGNNLPADRALSANTSSYGRAVCQPPGDRPVNTTLDRRKVTIAVVNCNAHNGQSGIKGAESGVQVEDWIDVFLVEPSHPRSKGNRTEYGDIYVEIIGTSAGAVGTQVQVVKKAVPYLIE